MQVLPPHCPSFNTLEPRNHLRRIRSTTGSSVRNLTATRLKKQQEQKRNTFTGIYQFGKAIVTLSNIIISETTSVLTKFFKTSKNADSGGKKYFNDSNHKDNDNKTTTTAMFRRMCCYRWKMGLCWNSQRSAESRPGMLLPWKDEVTVSPRFIGPKWWDNC